MLEAVFFDFDGVIADTEPLHLRAYQKVLAPYGLALSRDDYYARYLGYDDLGLFQALAADKGFAATPAQIDDWIRIKATVIEELLASDAILFPGAADCVRTFATQVPIAVASGALQPEIELVLEHAGLRGSFEAIASASDGVRGKPAPDLYLLAIAKIRHLRAVVPAHCIAIEDSRWGIDAARAAGLRCIAVTHTYPASEVGHADLVVDRLADVTTAAVEQLLRDNGARG